MSTTKCVIGGGAHLHHGDERDGDGHDDTWVDLGCHAALVVAVVMRIVLLYNNTQQAVAVTPDRRVCFVNCWLSHA